MYFNIKCIQQNLNKNSMNFLNKCNKDFALFNDNYNLYDWILKTVLTNEIDENKNQ